MIENIIVMGYGQIGKGIYKLNKEAGFNVEIYDPFLETPILPDYSKFNNKLDLIEVCIPFTNAKDFDETLNKFIVLEVFPKIRSIKNNNLIINIRTTIRLGFAFLFQDKFKDLVIIHTPIRATHPKIYEGIKEHTNFYGFADKYLEDKFNSKFVKYLDKLNIPYQKVKSSEEACLGKHVNTLWYGSQIAFANQIKRICEKRGLLFEEVYTMTMLSDKIGLVYKYNEDDRAFADEFIQRPTMIPGKLGGHCIMPNLEIIKMDLSNDFVKWIRDMDADFR